MRVITRFNVPPVEEAEGQTGHEIHVELKGQPVVEEVQYQHKDVGDSERSDEDGHGRAAHVLSQGHDQRDEVAHTAQADEQDVDDDEEAGSQVVEVVLRVVPRPAGRVLSGGRHVPAVTTARHGARAVYISRGVHGLRANSNWCIK